MAPAPSPSAAPPPRPAIKPRSGGTSYIAGLKDKLSIAPDQAQAWESFADVLSANSRRMETENEGNEGPFGLIEHRVAALDSMKRTGQVLLAVLSPARRGASLPQVRLTQITRAAVTWLSAGRSRATDSGD